MNIEALTAIGGVDEPLKLATGTQRAAAASNGGFESWLMREVAATNDKLVAADQGVRRLALGEADNLHQVMIALEEAKLRFDLVVQVRNRLVGAYQDVLRMRI